MKIFGTIFPFIENAEDSFRLGRHVANFEFFKALLANANFDEFHLFCLNIGHFNTTAQVIGSLGLPRERMEKIRLFLYPFLTRQLATTHYHVFHLGGWGYFFPGLVYLRNKYAQHLFPITGLIHSLNGMETPYHALKMALAPLLPYDTIICSSNAGRSVLEKTFERLGKTIPSIAVPPAFCGRYETIPLGFDDALSTPIEKSTARERLSIEPETILLLCIGRFSPATKMDLYPLLQAVQRMVPQTAAKVLLVLAGGGSDSNSRLVESMAHELGMARSIRVIKDFADDAKPLWYAAADIFVSPSDNLQETFGIAVIEAMASGLPVVVSDIDGYKELVDHGINGYKIPTIWARSLDPAELSDIMNFETMQLFLSQCMALHSGKLEASLLQLVNDPQLRKEMGAKGKEKIGHDYRWSSIVKRYEELWDRLSLDATANTGKPAPCENPFANDYLSSFSHYPTALLEDNSAIAITPAGHTALATQKLPIPYSDIAPFVPDQIVVEVLKELTSKNMTAAGFRTRLAGRLDSSWVEFILLWMAKYSLITIG